MAWISKLYHFTDLRNIESIKKHGLLCWKLLVDLKIQHYPASNQLSRSLDLNRGLENYVRLCLSPNHPMAYVAHKEGRIGNYKWLEISVSPIFWSATLFSDMNATSSSAVINNDRKTVINSSDLQAEVLVLNILSCQYILNL